MQIVIQFIIATNKVISPANVVVYKVAKAVMLNPGFEAGNRSIFNAYIGSSVD